MSKHTPGPWRVIRGGAVGAGEEGAEYGTAIAFGDGDEEEAANAHLIAAAPDLLALTRKFYRAMMVDGYDLDTLVELTHEARAAIAKAEGTE